jgi:hypothetical protein
VSLTRCNIGWFGMLLMWVWVVQLQQGVGVLKTPASTVYDPVHSSCVGACFAQVDIWCKGLYYVEGLMRAGKVS